MKKLLFITPHLSTGGLPNYLLKTLETCQQNFDLYVIEYSFVSNSYTVQRNKIINLIKPTQFFSLGINKKDLLSILYNVKPDIVHFAEIPEMFLELDLMKDIYDKSNGFLIYETTHSSDFNVNSKIVLPDKFIFVCPFSQIQYARFDIPSEVIEFPIENKSVSSGTKKNLLNKFGLDSKYKHIIVLGLFTPRKNQKYAFELAKKLENEKITFHFIGNQAPNFREYWEPLMLTKPNNCKVWGERNDVESFLSIADLSLFPSQGCNGDKELNPLSIKESLEFGIPTLIYDLDVYLDRYKNHDKVRFLSGNHETDTKQILTILNINQSTISNNYRFNVVFDDNLNKITITQTSGPKHELRCVVSDLDSDLPLYTTSLNFLGWESWFVIPIPPNVFDVKSVLTFAGYNIKLFYQNDLVYNFNLKYREVFKQPPQKIYASLDDSPFYNYYEFFHNDIYQSIDFSQFKTVVDCGANVGLFSLYCFSKGNPDRVIAIEPNIRAFNLLKKNSNSKMTLVNGALGVTDGNITLFESENNSTITSFKRQEWGDEFGKMREVKAECFSIPTLFKLYDIPKVDLFKIDIEGGEYELIEKTEAFVFEKIHNLLIEFHNNVNGEVSSLIKGLEEKNYFVNCFTPKGNLIDVAQSGRNGFIFAFRNNLGFNLQKFKTKQFLCIDKSGEFVIRDLYERGHRFTLDKYYAGEFDVYDYQFFEMFNFQDEGSQCVDCCYEKLGCQIESGDIVVDVGANIGIFANRAAYKGAKHVYCFEPNQLAFFCLLNNAPHNSTLFNVAVSDKESISQLLQHSSANDTGGSTLDDVVIQKWKRSEINIFQRFTVQTFPLVRYFELNLFNTIDFLKIDVEGHELSILNSLSDELIMKIRKIAFEYHPNIYPENSLIELISRFKQLGFNHVSFSYNDKTATHNLWQIN